MSVHRIALIFEFSTLNGGERSLLAVIEWLRAHHSGFEFQVIGPAEGRLADAFRCRGIPIIEWSLRENSGQRLSSQQIRATLLNTITNLNVDLVHANSLSMSRLVGQISSDLQIPTTGHLRDIIKLSKAAIDDLNRNCRLVAVSHATSDFHITQGLNEHLVTVIHNGIDGNSVATSSGASWLAEQLQIPFVRTALTDGASCNDDGTDRSSVPTGRHCGPVRFIAFVGQIGLRKGLDVLAAAAGPLLHQMPDLHLLLIGERSSTKAESIEYERSIRKRMFDEGIAQNVHWLGHREDVPQILADVDLLIHPANQEPFGRVLLEASATGLPIVATDVGGTAEIVVNGETGLLVPPRDPQALAEAALSLLSNPQRAIHMGQAGKQRTLRQFSIAGAATKIASCWTEVLDNFQSAKGV